MFSHLFFFNEIEVIKDIIKGLLVNEGGIIQVEDVAKGTSKQSRIPLESELCSVDHISKFRSFSWLVEVTDLTADV